MHPLVSRELGLAWKSPIPHGWPRACSGRKPLTLPGLLAKQPWTMKSVSVGIRVSSLRAPRGSPPASALPHPSAQGGSPGLAAVAAAVLLLPPGMCDRPKCSREIAQAGLELLIYFCVLPQSMQSPWITVSHGPCGRDPPRSQAGCPCRWWEQGPSRPVCEICFLKVCFTVNTVSCCALHFIQRY